MTPLLLLVDLQNDYLATPDLEPDAGSVVRRAEVLLAGCRELNIPVVHAWTTVSRRDDRRMPHWKRQGLWLCEEGTPGHVPPPGLKPRESEVIVHKTFFSPFSNADLDRVIRDEEIDLLIVAGVHLHGCVRQAVLDAYERDRMEIWVAEDATASDDPVHAAITRRYLESRATRFLPVADLLARLRHSDDRTATGEATAEVVRAEGRRCRAAQRAWQETDPITRARLVERLADRLQSETENLAHAMAVNIGKPVRYGSMEVQRAAEMLRAVTRRVGAAAELETAGSVELRRRPLGLVAVITPWNSPVYIPLGKIAPALLNGNSVLWKPAPAAHAIAEWLAGLFIEVGLPAGTVGIVAGGRRVAIAAMADPSVDAVTLTGSSLAGSSAQEICARRRIPLQAELGGNNAAVVWPDADLEDAARQIAEGAFALAGQRCTANRRVVTHRACRAELLKRLEWETAAMPWGDPRRPATRVGPIVSAEQRDRIADLIVGAEGTAGPVLVPHGAAVPDVEGFDGAWYPPTIVCCDNPSHELVQHETFGPVLVVQTAENWAHAMTLASGVRQGLAAALFSSSPDLTARFPDEAGTGIVKINRSTADADVDVPFGGWKSSGIGPPEHGAFDRDFYTRPQVVYRGTNGTF